MLKAHHWQPYFASTIGDKPSKLKGNQALSHAVGCAIGNLHHWQLILSLMFSMR
jgi:hypothetical protein